MNQMIKEGADVTLLPQETPGYMYNIREMGRSGEDSGRSRSGGIPRGDDGSKGRPCEPLASWV